MGQFKPMVKMETTEPSVILKLKKGGHVNMKKGGKAESGHKKMAMGGGAMDMMMGTPALVGRPAVNAPVRAPGKPSMSSRRKAMMAKKSMPSDLPMAMPPMKKGGKAEGGESKGMHKAEMSKMTGLEKELKSHESKPASKGHKGLKTGGVALGNAGGFKKGGMATGGVKMGNAGGFKTGGVSLGNAGGFKHGGKSSKKAYATGGTVNSGKPVAMPQGRKPASSPVRISELAGTYKGGGKVAPNNKSLQRVNDAEYAPSMRAANKNSDLKYGQRMNGGGSVSDKGADMSKGAYDAHYANQKAENEADSKAVEDFFMYLPRKVGKLFSGGDKEFKKPPSLGGERAVTKTKESVTVSPMGKKRGGSAC
tara:strand:- start:1071 stop:2165 length:1095 start_codon:yes stop_codon:yes gene_type:complete